MPESVPDSMASSRKMASPLFTWRPTASARASWTSPRTAAETPAWTASCAAAAVETSAVAADSAAAMIVSRARMACPLTES
jgi:hypothetical protein